MHVFHSPVEPILNASICLHRLSVATAAVHQDTGAWMLTSRVPNARRHAPLVGAWSRTATKHQMPNAKVSADYDLLTSFHPLQTSHRL